MKKPDFFVVGAPKCGTTSLCNYLDEHPDIYLSKPKEPGFFCSDCKSSNDIEDLESYLMLFEGREKFICGEGSTWYLFSERAPIDIKSFNCDAKIIIMIREPVSAMYSLHSENLHWNIEDQENFEYALSLETIRKQGKHVPRNCPRPAALYYRDIYSYYSQVKRYFDIFGESNIKVILFDDFKQYPEMIYKDVLEFLNVDSNHKAQFRVYNSNTRIKNLTLYKYFQHPPKWIFAFSNLITPKFLISLKRKVGWTFIKSAKSLLAKEGARPPLDLSLQYEIQKDMREDISNLGKLINKNLDPWLID